MNEIEKILINKMRELRLWTCRRGEPLVLHGLEGEIIYDLLELIVDDYDCRFTGCGRLFIDGSPIFTDAELSTQLNTYHGYIS